MPSIPAQKPIQVQIDVHVHAETMYLFQLIYLGLGKTCTLLM
jgi:hypothetical protein